ncbi:MAG TPA: NADPH:quinone oxidoreductase family protein [Acidimicrobiia bacterium]|nr:NADPH:quinone oxidoreductase family protein [Acidimicrobiia bacterium]
MRAARCQEYGPPEAIVVEDVPEPALREGGALIDVHAAAVNFPDVLLVANEYQVSIPVPFIPGSEFAGVVTAVADDVTGVAVGDRVFGSAFAGAFAEQIAMPVSALTRLPDTAEFAEAAAFGVAHTTAYHALRSVAEVHADDWVVVLGAAGGVGLAAVELATVLGARVVAAASNADKLQLCGDRGAVATVDYTTEDLKARIKDITGGGADVVIDPVGGPYSEAALRATRWGGRFVVVGFASGEIPRIPLNLVLLKGVVIKGFEFRTFAEHAPDAARRDRDELSELFATGRVRPHVSAVFPLDETAVALRAMADRRVLGKIIIDPTRS